MANSAQTLFVMYYQKSLRCAISSVIPHMREWKTSNFLRGLAISPKDAAHNFAHEGGAILGILHRVPILDFVSH